MLFSVAFRKFFKGGQCPFDTLGGNTICQSKMTGAAKSVTGDKEQIELLCPFTECHSILFQAPRKQLECALWLYAMKSHFTQ